MSQRYQGETREIVADFLTALEGRRDLDPYFLAELKQLAQKGTLGHSSRVTEAVRILQAQGAGSAAEDRRED